MSYRVRPVLVGIATLVAANTAACQLPVAKDRQVRYDGTWWLAASQAERNGFLAGFIDCYKFDAKGPARFEARPLTAYRDSLSRYFESGGPHLKQSVVSVLATVGDRPGEQPPSGGEEWHESHGYFDGNYWRQSFGSGGSAHQIGFVEGYVACNRQLGAARRATFTAPATEYVHRINQWYQFDSTTADMEPTREKAKIVDVLFKFRDRKR